MTDSAPIVDIRDLAFAHPGGFTLRTPALRIDPAERIALIGPSGSGKTTLLDLIAGIRLPTSGTVSTLGRDWSRLAESARRDARLREIGMVFQEFELLEYLSARENILLAATLAPSSAAPRDPHNPHNPHQPRQRAADLASAAGITHVLDRPPSRLSQGERQRVSLCRGLLLAPKLILCDEPTGNLDPRSARAVIDLLFTQAARDHAALIVATHDHALLADFDRVIDLAAASTPAPASLAGAAP